MFYWCWAWPIEQHIYFRTKHTHTHTRETSPDSFCADNILTWSYILYALLWPLPFILALWNILVHNKLIFQQLSNSISQLILETIHFTCEFYYYTYNTKVSLTKRLSWIHGSFPLLAIWSRKLNIDGSSKENHDSLGANGIIKD